MNPNQKTFSRHTTARFHPDWNNRHNNNNNNNNNKKKKKKKEE
jgi:hypothetical protein